MRKDMLVYNSEVTIDGEEYTISVYCKADGRHYAKTYLTEHDIIINDADSVSEVLEVHRGLLPLAVTARRSREHLKSDMDKGEGLVS